jgi:tetratricopeptide (TPR) repeat protein
MSNPLSTTTTTSIRTQYEKLIETGVYIQYEQLYDQSISYFTQAIKLMPNESEGYLRRSLAYYSLHRDTSKEKVIDEIRLGLQLCNKTLRETDRCVLEALLLELEKKDIDKARMLYERAIQYDYLNYFAVFSIGYLYDCDDKYDKAIEYYELSLTRKPKFSPCIIYNNIGRCYEMLDKQLSGRSASVSPITTTTSSTATVADTDQQQSGSEFIDKALHYYNKAIESYDRCFLARLNRAKLLVKNKRYTEAQEDLKFILSINPHHFTAMTRLADIDFFHLDRKEEAIEQYQRIQKIHPTMGYPYRINAAYENIVKKQADNSFQVLDVAINNMIHVDQVYQLYLLKSQFHKKLEQFDDMQKEHRNGIIWPETVNRLKMKQRMFQPVKKQFRWQMSPMEHYLEQYDRGTNRMFLDIEIITQI